MAKNLSIQIGLRDPNCAKTHWRASVNSISISSEFVVHSGPLRCYGINDAVSQTAMKSQLDNNSAFSAKRAYNAEVNQLSVHDAAIAPPFATVERTLQRHKVKNRPRLPTTRQAFVLPASYTTTTDGRPFKLIDDGQADRIIVFGTPEQLSR